MNLIKKAFLAGFGWTLGKQTALAIWQHLVSLAYIALLLGVFGLAWLATQLLAA